MNQTPKSDEQSRRVGDGSITRKARWQSREAKVKRQEIVFSSPTNNAKLTVRTHNISQNEVSASLSLRK